MDKMTIKAREHLLKLEENLGSSYKEWKYIGGDRKRHNRYYESNFSHIPRPTRCSYCVCGHKIDTQCYIIHKQSKQTRVVGNICFHIFPNSYRQCAICGNRHRSRLSDLCRECKKDNCWSCHKDIKEIRDNKKQKKCFDCLNLEIELKHKQFLDNCDNNLMQDYKHWFYAGGNKGTDLEFFNKHYSDYLKPQKCHCGRWSDGHKMTYIINKKEKTIRGLCGKGHRDFFTSKTCNCIHCYRNIEERFPQCYKCYEKYGYYKSS